MQLYSDDADEAEISTDNRESIPVPQELNDFALEVGKFIQYWGFKRIHGQIWTHIYLSDHPLDAKELMQRLDISKALVSITLKDLMEYDVVWEAGKGPHATMTYVANPDLIRVILAVLKKRELEMLGKIEDTFAVLKQLPKLSELNNLGLNLDRVAIMEKLVHKARKQLSIILTLGNLDLKVWNRIRFK